jgi:hypothetical protein
MSVPDDYLKQLDVSWTKPAFWQAAMICAQGPWFWAAPEEDTPKPMKSDQSIMGIHLARIISARFWSAGTSILLSGPTRNIQLPPSHCNAPASFQSSFFQQRSKGHFCLH